MTPPPSDITVYRQPGTVAGAFIARPKGIILHGSRSGRDWSIEREFDSCRNFAAGGANGLGWNATVGPLAYSVHIDARHWGWSAGSPASGTLLAVEFAQATIDDPVTDDMVAAFVHWYEHEVVPAWGALDLSDDAALPCHSELAQGQAQGKSDVFLPHSTQAADLRARIRGAL